MKTITVCNQKGGSGKTTTAVLLCLGIARQDKKVLLIDTDPQGGATAYFKAESDSGVYDVVMQDTPEPVKTESGVFVLSADYRLDKVFSSADIYTFADVKDDYKQFDYIVFDTPPTLQGITKSCLFISDYIITPTDISRGSIKPVQYTVDEIKRMKKKTNVFFIGYKENAKGFLKTVQDEFITAIGKPSGAIVKNINVLKIASGEKMTPAKEKLLTEFTNEILKGGKL